MVTQKKGLFCVVEGLDGAGKSTAISILDSWQKQVKAGDRPDLDRWQLTAPMEAVFRDYDWLFLQEPTRLETGLEIRRRLAGDQLTDYRQWIDLFKADRQANLQTFVEPALLESKLIVQDRYFYSTAAYQGSLSDVDPLLVLAEFSGFRSPDLLLYLDIDADTAFARIENRSSQKEVFERRDRWLKIQGGYEKILPPSVKRIDASLPPQQVAYRMLEYIAKAACNTEVN